MATGREREAELELKVKQALRLQVPSVGWDIQVNASGGTVTLSGIVDVLAERVKAEEAAREVPGVAALRNGLTVGTDARIADKEIEASLSEALAKNPRTAAITAQVRGGVVTLLGTVDCVARAREAQAAAGSTKGVRGVINRVRVEAATDDVSITNAVERALANSAVGAGYIDTVTRGGKVWLRGWVDDASERDFVRELAEEVQGVQAVSIELHLRGADL